MIEAYPLQWPVGWPRTEASARTRAKFSASSWAGTPGGLDNRRVFRELTIADGAARIMAELRRLGVDGPSIVISSNLRVRLDGLPISKQRNPDDVGVAVYWADRTGERRCMAIDIYDRIADNLGAVAATIEAMRAIERHGGARVLERAFTGFTALPAPITTRAWWQILELDPNEKRESALEDAYRTLRSKHHPDKGGSNEMFIEVRRAYDQARAVMGLP